MPPGSTPDLGVLQQQPGTPGEVGGAAGVHPGVEFRRAQGALASIGWFTAFALTSAANVRTLGMVEVVFSYAVSHRLLREQLSRAETAGLLLVMAGVGALCLQL